jgi:hypothetical protein
MKRLAIILIPLVLFGSATIGKNYIIYHEVSKFQEQHPDKLQIQSKDWSWQGVSLQGLQITNLVKNTTETCQINHVSLSHEWLKPLEIQVIVDHIQAPQVIVAHVEGGLSYLSSTLSSKDLALTQATISIDKKHKITNIDIPHATLPFIYKDSTHELTLDLDIPAFQNTELATVAVKASGKMVVKPSLDGTLDVKIKGVSKVIDMLVESKIIKAKKAEWFILGSKFLGGSDGESTLPLSFNKGSIFLGPLMIYNGDK